nr:reverse transcriptase domain-containing protein [Tanacetum cinerariifolium]
MHTRSSSNLPVVSSNLSTSNPKHRNRKRSKKPFILEESPIDTMADQRTMAKLLRAPTEGYTEDRYKDLLHAFPHHGFTKLHQLDTFYNALNPSDQDSLNAAAGGNLLERRTHDVLTIIKNKSKIAKLTHAVNQQTSAVTTAMTAILKQFQATPPPASVKVVEEICVTCGGAHPYYQFLAAGGNTFLELLDNIQGYVSTAAFNYNEGNFVYRPPGMANQIRTPGFTQPNVQNNQNRFGQPQGFNRGNNFNPEQSYQAPTQQNQIVPLNELEKVKRIDEANMKAMQTQINIVKNELRNEMKNSIQASLSNQTNEIKNMIASLFQMNTASTSGSGCLPSNIIANPKEDERVEETLMDLDLSEYTIKVPPPPLHINITLANALILMPKYKKMLKALLSNKEKLQELENIPFNENCSAVILKKLPKKLKDPGKFLLPCGFSELKYKALADLGASINLMPLSVWKKLGLPKLISTHMTLELANQAICTPAGIARDVFVLVGKFTFPADFFIVDYESDPRVPLILGRPFLRTARALIDVHREEMILHDEGGNVPLAKLLDLDSTKDLHPPLHVNPLSGSTTYSSSPSPLLEELADELALITFPPKYDDLQFDVKFDLKEIEFLLHQDIDSSLKDLIDQSNLVNPANNFVDSMLVMFTDEHALEYSSPLIIDEYDDDFLEVESNTENIYDDPFNSKGEKIKESKLLIDELDLPCDFHPSKYDLFISEDFSKVDAKPSTNNKDKVFNPGILIQENPFEIITRVVQDKKLATSNASLVIKDFDPPFYEPLIFKEVPKSNMLLLFSSKNEEKKFSNQGFTLLKKFILLISQNYLIKAIMFSKSTRFSRAR